MGESIPQRQLSIKAAIVSGLFVFFFVGLSILSVMPRESVSLVIAVGVQVFGGAYWWSRLVLSRRVQRGTDFLETLGAGVGLGTLLSALSFAAARELGVQGPVWLIPAVLGVVDWVIARVRGRVRPPALMLVDPATLIASVVGLVLGILTLFVGLRRYPLPFTAETSSTYHPDVFLFERLASFLAGNGPGDSETLPLFTGDSGRILYHWLAYGWAGDLSATVGAGSYVTLTRVIPLMSMVGLVLLVASWTRSLGSSRFTPTLAVLFLVAGGFVGAEMGSVVNLESPSQTMSILWLVMLLRLATLTISGQMNPFGAVVLVGVASFGVTGGKASSAALGVGAVLIIALGAQGPRRLTAWLVAASCTLGFAVGYVFFFFGSSSYNASAFNLLSLDRRPSTFLELDPSPGSAGVLIGTFILVLAILPRWAGIIWWIHDAGWRSQESLMALGVMIAAIGPLLVLSQGVDEVWGVSAATGPLAPVAAAGVGLAWRRLKERTLQVASVVVGVAAVLMSTVLYGGGLGVGASTRWMAPLAPYALATGIVLMAAVLRQKGVKLMIGLASATVILTIAALGGRLIINV